MKHHIFTLTVRVNVFGDVEPTRQDLKDIQIDVPTEYTTLEYEVVKITKGMEQ